MCLEGEVPPLRISVEYSQMLLINTCRDAIAGLNSVCFSLTVISKRNSWRNEALGRLILLYAPVTGGAGGCTAVSVFAVFVQQPCLPSESTIACCHTGVLKVIETVLHGSREGGEWWWGAPPAPAVALCVISACISFPLGGPCLLMEGKKKKKMGGREWAVASALFYQMRHHYPLCSHKVMQPPLLGRYTPSGLAERALLCSHLLGTIHWSPVPSSSGWINISVTLLTSQDPRNHPWSSSFAEEKTWF